METQKAAQNPDFKFEGISFTTQVVASYDADTFVAKHKGKYFGKDSNEEEKLRAVHAQALQLWGDGPKLKLKTEEKASEAPAPVVEEKTEVKTDEKAQKNNKKDPPGGNPGGTA